MRGGQQEVGKTKPISGALVSSYTIIGEDEGQEYVSLKLQSHGDDADMDQPAGLAVKPGSTSRAVG
jgi:hypothetical protein